MLLVDSIFSDYTATCLSVYQSHSKSLPFHEASYIVQNQYTVRVLCCLTGDTIMASPPVRVTLYRRGKKNHAQHSPFLRAGFSRGLRDRKPTGTLSLFWLQFASFSVQDPFTWPLWFTAPRGLRHPMAQQTWPDRGSGNELLPVPSSALSLFKHLPHVQFSTALNSGKSKPILTGTLQDTSLQHGLSICLTNSDLLLPAALALKLFLTKIKKNKKK